jgi:hypothetical protein
MRKIAFILIVALLMEIPAIATVPPTILKDKVTVWSGTIELKSDVVVPEDKTLIIYPGTSIYCVYDYENENFTPAEWKIIVKGNLIAKGETNNSITIDSIPYGLSAIRVPVGPDIEKISISPQNVETKKIKEEFSVFRLQYLALWTMLFAGVYYAIKSRKD